MAEEKKKRARRQPTPKRQIPTSRRGTPVQPENQDNARLGLLAITPIASILFALAALVGNDLWRGLSMSFSALMGTLSLFVGVITLIFQIKRQALNIRNLFIFAALYILSVFVFMGSCTVQIVSGLD